MYEEKELVEGERIKIENEEKCMDKFLGIGGWYVM